MIVSYCSVYACYCISWSDATTSLQFNLLSFRPSGIKNLQYFHFVVIRICNTYFIYFCLTKGLRNVGNRAPADCSWIDYSGWDT